LKTLTGSITKSLNHQITKFQFAALVLLLVASAAAQAPQRDTQMWNEFLLIKHLQNHFSVTAWMSLRSVDNITRLGEEHVGGAASYDVVRKLPAFAADNDKSSTFRYFSGAVWYRFQRQADTGVPLVHENRLFVEGTARLPLPHGFRINDRNRYEWRWIGGRYSNRYRNRYELEKEFAHVTPFIAGETFYDWRFHEWNRQRDYVGLRLPKFHHAIFETYFMHEDDSHALPHKNVIGTALRFEY